MNTKMKIFKSINSPWARDYNFENITDLATAALVKDVLGNYDEAYRREILDKLISPEMREYSCGSVGVGTVEADHIPRDIWIGVDKGLIADLINEGKTIDTSAWNEANHNKGYKKAVRFLKYDFLPKLNGAEYVEHMPDELARFLTDCWLRETWETH